MEKCSTCFHLLIDRKCLSLQVEFNYEFQKWLLKSISEELKPTHQRKKKDFSLNSRSLLKRALRAWTYGFVCEFATGRELTAGVTRCLGERLLLEYWCSNLEVIAVLHHHILRALLMSLSAYSFSPSFVSFFMFLTPPTPPNSHLCPLVSQLAFSSSSCPLLLHAPAIFRLPSTHVASALMLCQSSNSSSPQDLSLWH